jgi:hypothetical protein
MDEKVIMIIREQIKTQIVFMTNMEYVCSSMGQSVIAEKMKALRENTQGLLETLDETLFPPS